MPSPIHMEFNSPLTNLPPPPPLIPPLFNLGANTPISFMPPPPLPLPKEMQIRPAPLGMYIVYLTFVLQYICYFYIRFLRNYFSES